MSDSKKYLAPAAVACALTAAAMPSDAYAKKVDCDAYKPDRTTEQSMDKSKAVNANVTGAGGGGASASTASSTTQQALSDEEIAKANEVYRACQMYKDGLLDETEWKLAKQKFLGIAAPVAPAPAPAGTAPAAPAPAPAPAAAPAPAPIVVVQTSGSAPTTSTAPSKNASGGGGKGGKLILWSIIAVVAVGLTIVTIRAVSDGGSSDDDATPDTGGIGMMVSPVEANVAVA